MVSSLPVVAHLSAISLTLLHKFRSSLKAEVRVVGLWLIIWGLREGEGAAVRQWLRLRQSASGCAFASSSLMLLLRFRFS